MAWITPRVRANFQHLYRDTFWFGVLLGSALAFIAIYATRLGATSFQISLLTAGPAVVNLVVSLPMGRWLEGKPLVRVTFWSAVVGRAGYLLIIFLPWLFEDSMEVWVIVWITLLMALPSALLVIAFNAMFVDAVPNEVRAEVVGKRNALQAISLTATAVLCGQILDRVAFPMNYQIVFLIGAIGAALSTYHVGRVKLALQLPPVAASPDAKMASTPEGTESTPVIPSRRFLRRFGFANSGNGVRLDLLRTSYGPFMAAFLVFYTFQYVPIPIFPLYQVRVLELKDSAISLGSVIFYAVMFLVSLRLGYLSARHGHHRLLTIGALAFTLYPLLLAMAWDATLFWAASLLGGAVWALLSAGLINRLMERVPDDARTSGMALHNLALNLGILAGSLLGPLLSQWLGLREALYIASGLRLAAGIVIMIWG